MNRDELNPAKTFVLSLIFGKFFLNFEEETFHSTFRVALYRGYIYVAIRQL